MTKTKKTKTKKKKNHRKSNEVNVFVEYMMDKKVSIDDLADTLAINANTIHNWIRTGTAAEWAVNYVKLLQSGVGRKKNEQGDLVVAYVPKAKKSAFSSLCQALNINAKSVL